MPLWQDVVRIANIRLAEPSSSATHFLGAIVLQAQDSWAGKLPARTVVDGQHWQANSLLSLTMVSTSLPRQQRS